jgi:uncharacterized RDD family membrane protein YckC
MAESYEQTVKSSYEKMSDEELIERNQRGGLTEEASTWLAEEIKKRDISPEISSSQEEDAPKIAIHDSIFFLASRKSRFFAYLIDYFLAVLLLAAGLAVGEVTNYPLGGLIGFFTAIGYSLFRDSLSLSHRQSLGKRVLKIRVIDRKSGNYCKALASFKRNFIFYIPLLNLIDMVMIFGRKRERLGDTLADTAVIVDKP